jgi:hypothetical protein
LGTPDYGFGLTFLVGHYITIGQRNSKEVVYRQHHRIARSGTRHRADTESHDVSQILAHPAQ